MLVLDGWAGRTAQPALAAPPAPDARAAGELELDVLHLNIYGHVGNADSDEEVRALVENLVQLIGDRQPDLVSLNEVCKSQADGLRDALAGRYRLYASLAWWPAVTKPACGGSFGRAILVREDLARGGKPFVRQLPVDRQRDLAKRPIVCLAMWRVTTVFCTTHLTAGGGEERDRERALQVEKIHRTFAPYNAVGWNIILGADMNMRPSDPNLNSVYEPSYGDGAYGIYREAHPDRTTKEPTTDGGSPIDYIFVNNRPLSISTPTITEVEYSDHHVYEATVLLGTHR
jgi:endonuclease/exonuclease/phosphatase family metal-dependent hydrolase